MTIHALLVAIDAYVAADQPAVRLPQRHGRAAHVPGGAGRAPSCGCGCMEDDAATRDTLVAAFRDHLGAAGPGDVALFAFFGHGSEEPAPAEIAALEPTGRLQTILLHDCGRRIDGKLRRALADKELSLLIAEVAATGAHVVTILDCCHAGGGTRDPFARPRSWRPLLSDVAVADRDVVVELAAARPSSEFLPGALEQWSAPAARPRRPRRVPLRRAGQGAPRRRRHPRGVLGRARRVARRARHAHDVPLAAGDGASARRAHDGGPAARSCSRSTSAGRATRCSSTAPSCPSPRRSRSPRDRTGGRSTAGIVHGFRDPVGDEAFVLACHDDAGAALGTVRVTSVDVGRSLVEPVGWAPAGPGLPGRDRRPCRCRPPRSSSTRRRQTARTARTPRPSRRSTPRCGPPSPRPDRAARRRWRSASSTR